MVASDEEEDEADSKDNIKIEEVRNVTGKKTGKKQQSKTVIKKEKDSVESKNVAEPQVDEYDQDSSDEEVSLVVSSTVMLGSQICHQGLQQGFYKNTMDESLQNTEFGRL